MSVAKVIEIIAKSEKSWEDATQKAVAQASKTVRNITSVYVKDLQAAVSDGKVTFYKVTVKISFVIDG